MAVRKKAKKRVRAGRTATGRIKKGYYLSCNGGSVKKREKKEENS